MLLAIISSLEQGLIFSLLAMGVYISYKILDFPDLSVEGSFPAGAFIFAKMSLSGFNAITSIIASGVFGIFIGFLTAKLFIKLKIKPILSGIITLTIMYSVNLRINGKSNIPLFDSVNIFKDNMYINIFILIIIVLIFKIIIDEFFKTDIGYLLLATGDNETLVKSLGENPNKYKTIGLIISNSMVAISGSLMAQNMLLADIQMGSGIIIIALASIIIGDSILKRKFKMKGTTRAIIGAISYKAITGVSLSIGLNPNDLKAVTALIIIIFIAYNNVEIKGESNAKNKKNVKSL